MKDEALPFPVAPHVTMTRIEIRPGLALVLLTGDFGLLSAVWRLSRGWADVQIGRA